MEHDLHELKRILTERLFTTLFQPIIDCKSGQLLGLEALVRGPEGSSLFSPERIFATAQQYDLLFAVERAVSEQAIACYVLLGKPGRLFLNFSPVVLGDNSTLEWLENMVERYQLRSGDLVMELSESYVIGDIQALAKQLERCREHGFVLAIDDLGAGYSGLRLWSELHPEYVKIDRHFIKDIDKDPVKHEFMRGIVELSQRLGCGIIAEGVETRAELQTVNQLGINLCQGFYLGRPSTKPKLSCELDDDKLSAVTALPIKYSETVQVLCSYVEPLPINVTLAKVWDRFKNREQYSSLPVVHNGRLIGLIHRALVLEMLSGPYGRALYAKKRASELVTDNAIVVEKMASLGEVSQMVTDEDDMYVRQHFVIVDQGRYVGMGNTRDLLRRITEVRLMHARHANPLTLLPGNVPINQHIQQQIDAEADFTVAYVDINHFKPYNDLYGYQRGDEVIQLVGKLLRRHCESRGHFVGHVGGDDFVTVFNSESGEEICQQICKDFVHSQRELYNDQDYNHGTVSALDRSGEKREFPLVSLSIGLVPAHPALKRVDDYALQLSEAKKQAKSAGQSSVVIYRPEPTRLCVSI